jgi:phosphoribosyl 1,2-cyclic phosphodiesterase
LRITFFGVRGSTPSPSPDTSRYGGNTSAVVIERAGGSPIVFDLGTGLRVWGEGLPLDGSFRGTCLLSHIHWDHIQGLPFFAPINRAGAELDIYAPAVDDLALHEAFDRFIRPPYFPIQYTDLAGAIRFHAVSDTDLEIGSAKIKVRPVPHTGLTVGYRVDCDGASVAYIPDHQAPYANERTLDQVAASVLELCSGVDLLIHDAQYTPAEFAGKCHWGHCTIDYALLVAKEAGARRIALFHHDPSHTDERLDALHAEARRQGEMLGLEEVLCAREGLQVDL